MKDFIAEAKEYLDDTENQINASDSYVCKCIDCKFCNREMVEEEFYCEIYETFTEAEEAGCADFEWREEYVED